MHSTSGRASCCGRGVAGQLEVEMAKPVTKEAVNAATAADFAKATKPLFDTLDKIQKAYLE